MNAFEKYFGAVPAVNTPAYFWFIIFKMDQEELLAQLHDMYDHGVRNVCLHPVPTNWRPGTYLRTEMSPDYLSEDYFRIIRRLVDECKTLGMHYYLYDEGGWPSGGACGKVLDGAPEWKRKWMTADENGDLHVVEEPFNPNKAMLPDLLAPGATEKFIRLTHENHRTHLQEHIGSTLKIAFMDEPAIAVSSDNKLTWTPDFAEEFKKRKGYDIVPHLKELLKPAQMSDSGKIIDLRIDYQEVRTQLFIERFLKPIQNWCKTNNMLSGGHFDGEDTPDKSSRRTYGSIMKSLRYLDVPGVDLIWRQIWPGLREHSFPRYASSAAHQQGNTYSLGELFGVYGNGMTPDTLRYIIDYVMVHGINLLVYGSYPQRNAKNWTAGCRPHFGPDDPLWKYFNEFHDYASRASYLLSCGKPLRTTALVFDTRSLWADNWENADAEYQRENIAERLRARRVLFDFIDEDVIAESKIEGKVLAGPHIRYSELVIPQRRRLSDEAEKRIAEFISAGGKVTESPEEAATEVKVSPDHHQLWLEARLLDDKRKLYFFFNSGTCGITPQITLPGAEKVVLADPASGKVYNIRLDENGSFSHRFGKFDTAFFISGMEVEDDLPAPAVLANSRMISGSWQLVPRTRHVIGKNGIEIHPVSGEAVTAAPGDWRKYLGEDFSGDAAYITDFVWDGEVPQKVLLDLGTVNYCCQVVLNGRDYGKQFRGPFVFDISDSLRSGINHLEITVTNTLANAYSPREVELQMETLWPPRSGYENRQRVYERDSLVSGLAGPVVIRY